MKKIDCLKLGINAAKETELAQEYAQKISEFVREGLPEQ